MGLEGCGEYRGSLLKVLMFRIEALNLILLNKLEGLGGRRKLEEEVADAHTHDLKICQSSLSACGAQTCLQNKLLIPLVRTLKSWAYV